MPIESPWECSKCVVNRNFALSFSALRNNHSWTSEWTPILFYLKMNIKDLDDLNICRRTYVVNVHMLDEIGASRSIRLIAVRSWRTNIYLSILPYMITPFYSIWNVEAIGSTSLKSHRSNDQFSYSKNKFPKFLPQKRSSRELVIWLEFCCKRSFLKMNTYAKIYGVSKHL